ncbi:MAG: SGNH/GDSL hydrolase family protein [Clostridiales bacterium]|nr:SGNH/GDSL hydrolase family protein [Clostridiales bacterium]
MEQKNKKRYSILGDSVSTFSGYTPAEAVFYDRWVQTESGVACPEDTWWMQVIQGMDGQLGVNNSYAGSLVAGGVSVSGTSETRLRALGAQGAPDVILVAMGANDWGFCVLPQEFEHAYRRMLYRLKCLYPQAKIYCATLLRGRLAEEDDTMFFNVEATISQEVYSDIIRKAAREAELCIADLGSYRLEYDSIDGVHPDKQGMKTIADLWLRELRK